MNISLRTFRYSVLFLAFLCGCSTIAPKREMASHEHVPVLMGPSVDGIVQFSILSSKQDHPSYRISDGHRIYTPSSQQRLDHPSSMWVFDHVSFSNVDRSVGGLRLQILSESDQSILDERELRLPSKNPISLRIALASCMDDNLDEVQKKIWPELLSHHPDWIFLMGDNYYGDKLGQTFVPVADGPLLWRRAVETRQHLALYRSPILYPIIGLWDDHDYGMNDGNSTFVFKKESKQVFDAFFAQAPIAQVFELGPGVSSFLQLGADFQFAFLDDRSLRSPNGALPETHWGLETESWLMERLNRSPRPTWLIQGDQFFGGYHRHESYEGDHPKRFKQLLGELRKVRSPVFLVSGDRHLVQLQKIESEILGYEAYELTTSAIHAKVFSGALKAQPSLRQIEGVDGEYNYAIVDLKSVSNEAQSVRIEALGAENRSFFQRDLLIKK